ncbi:MAG: ABC transporter substrate-binding protein [Caldilineaceae bacterium SB0661_bin_32]|uniref:ABC transporter substrate-binding protein n=1 Tax=Caldilineaceae bacterium SB0661_bin_32 TaxID=2605255 RepID=A0A6B1D9B7_9CHLR|nr:ABC transporter substrate-binding protein [Caldilineaceae bacterium SB0661_bin_32]
MRTRLSRTTLLIAMLMAVALATACVPVAPAAQSGDGSAALKDVTLLLDWTPNTNHTGIYVAQDKGWYEEAGLNVDIVIPGESDVHQVVGAGSADFGVSYQEGATFARVEGVPIVSVAAVIQHNTSGFASRSSAGIGGPTDLAGKRYGSFGSPIEYPTIDLLMKCAGGSAEDVEFIDVGWADFLSITEADQVDFAWIYYAWTGINAELQGIDLDIIMLKDYLECIPDYYTPILITSESMIASDPETVSAFVGATARGFEFAIENAAAAADILLAANPDLDADLVHASQEWLANEYRAEAAQWGIQTGEVWQAYADFLIDGGIIESFEGESAYTNEFLPEKE